MIRKCKSLNYCCCCNVTMTNPERFTSEIRSQEDEEEEEREQDGEETERQQEGDTEHVLKEIKEAEEESEVWCEDDQDFTQEYYDEDVTVSPIYMDEIIKALVKKCEETLREEKQQKSLFENEEFPPLETFTIATPKARDIRLLGVAARASTSQMSSNPDYEIR